MDAAQLRAWLDRYAATLDPRSIEWAWLEAQPARLAAAERAAEWLDLQAREAYAADPDGYGPAYAAIDRHAAALAELGGPPLYALAVHVAYRLLLQADRDMTPDAARAALAQLVEGVAARDARLRAAARRQAS